MKSLVTILTCLTIIVMVPFANADNGEEIVRIQLTQKTSTSIPPEEKKIEPKVGETLPIGDMLKFIRQQMHPKLGRLSLLEYLFNKYGEEKEFQKIAEDSGFEVIDGNKTEVVIKMDTEENAISLVNNNELAQFEANIIRRLGSSINVVIPIARLREIVETIEGILYLIPPSRPTLE